MENALAGYSTSCRYISIFYKFCNYISAGLYISACFYSAFKDNIGACIYVSPFYNASDNDVSACFNAEIAGNNAFYFNAAFKIYITCGNIYIFKNKDVGYCDLSVF